MINREIETKLENVNNKAKKNNFDINCMFRDNDFTPDDVAKGLLLFLVFKTAVGLIYTLFYYIGLTSSVFSYVFNILLDVSFIMTVYVVAKNKKINTIKQLKVKKAPNILTIFVCLGISVVCIFGFSGVTNCFLEVLYRIGYSPASEDIVISNVWIYILYTITICVIPAICEEILFRGLMFTGLKKISTTVGVFGSAFIFMIIHGSPDQTVHQFLLGIVLALAFMITNNLWVSILIHFFNNFIAVTLAFISYGQTQATNGEVVEIYLSQYFIYAVVSAVITIAIIYLLFKALSSINSKKREELTSVDGGTINSEIERDIEMDIVKAQEYSVEISDVNGENREQIYISPQDLKNKLSKQGKFLMVVSVVWLVLEWLISLVNGFGV